MINKFTSKRQALVSMTYSIGQNFSCFSKGIF